MTKSKWGSHGGFIFWQFSSIREKEKEKMLSTMVEGCLVVGKIILPISYDGSNKR